MFANRSESNQADAVYGRLPYRVQSCGPTYLLSSNETGVTWSELGVGGGVRHLLPLRRGDRGNDARAVR